MIPDRVLNAYPHLNYTVFLASASGEFIECKTTRSTHNARVFFLSFQQEQIYRESETLCALVAGDRLVKATLGEMNTHNGQRVFTYKDYNGLSVSLRLRTQAVWQRADLRNVR